MNDPLWYKIEPTGCVGEGAFMNCVSREGPLINHNALQGKGGVVNYTVFKHFASVAEIFRISLALRDARRRGSKIACRNSEVHELPMLVCVQLPEITSTVNTCVVFLGSWGYCYKISGR